MAEMAKRKQVQKMKIAKQIAKVLQVGDVVYSSANGKPMKITKVYPDGFDTEDDFYSFDEHQKLFWLTKFGYQNSVEKEGAEK